MLAREIISELHGNVDLFADPGSLRFLERPHQCGFGNAGDVDAMRRRPRHQIGIQRDTDGFAPSAMIIQRIRIVRSPGQNYPCISTRAWVARQSC